MTNAHANSSRLKTKGITSPTVVILLDSHRVANSDDDYRISLDSLFLDSVKHALVHWINLVEHFFRHRGDRFFHRHLADESVHRNVELSQSLFDSEPIHAWTSHRDPDSLCDFASLLGLKSKPRVD